MAFDRIAVVGAGAWGTALANAIARAGRAVLLATRDRAGADVLVEARESPRLPGVRLHEHVGRAARCALNEGAGRSCNYGIGSVT
jgi:glycerol-3-phosphate dehydrogenase (NAD(P)+)